MEPMKVKEVNITDVDFESHDAGVRICGYYPDKYITVTVMFMKGFTKINDMLIHKNESDLEKIDIIKIIIACEDNLITRLTSMQALVKEVNKSES